MPYSSSEDVVHHTHLYDHDGRGADGAPGAAEQLGFAVVCVCLAACLMVFAKDGPKKATCLQEANVDTATLGVANGRSTSGFGSGGLSKKDLERAARHLDARTLRNKAD